MIFNSRKWLVSPPEMDEGYNSSDWSCIRFRIKQFATLERLVVLHNLHHRIYLKRDGCTTANENTIRMFSASCEMNINDFKKKNHKQIWIHGGNHLLIFFFFPIHSLSLSLSLSRTAKKERETQKLLRVPCQPFINRKRNFSPGNRERMFLCFANDNGNGGGVGSASAHSFEFHVSC